MSAPELAARLKAAIRGEGEPGHPGEMISVVEAEYLIDEVFAEVEAALSDTDLADAHARYHDQAGNMLWENDCAWSDCKFWEIATFVAARASQPVQVEVTESPCAFQLEQCRCDLPRAHGGLHECRNHRFSDRPLAALGGVGDE